MDVMLRPNEMAAATIYSTLLNPAILIVPPLFQPPFKLSLSGTFFMERIVENLRNDEQSLVTSLE